MWSLKGADAAAVVGVGLPVFGAVGLEAGGALHFESGVDVSACTMTFLFARACNGRDTRPTRSARAVARVVSERSDWVTTDAIGRERSVRHCDTVRV